MKLQLFDQVLDHHPCGHMTPPPQDGCPKKSAEENMFGIELAYLFELRSDFLYVNIWSYCLSFELLRKSYLVTALGLGRILAF